MGYINIIISPIIIQHEEEKPHTVGVGGASEKDASQKLSKSALKNKRKGKGGGGEGVDIHQPHTDKLWLVYIVSSQRLQLPQRGGIWNREMPWK